MTDRVQYVTNTKWKWAGHIARMKDNRWTIKSTEWHIKGVRSVGRPKRRWRDGTVGQQGTVWTRIAKDRESWTTGGRLLPVVEGHSPEQKKIDYFRSFLNLSLTKWMAISCSRRANLYD